MSTAAPELSIDLNARNVRKWGRVRFGLSAYGDKTIALPTKPSDLFDSTTFKPKPFPAGVKDMGYLTTDGLNQDRSISSNNTMGLQSLIPVRSDLESVEDSLTGAFLEANAWTEAFYHLLPIEQWPAERDGARFFLPPTPDDVPDYVVWMVGADGKGSSAVFRYKVLFRTRITSLEGRTMNRSDPETFGFTLGIFDEEGTPFVEGFEGPGVSTHLTYGGSTAAGSNG